MKSLFVRALKERWIAGAALDAFAKQPLPVESELWNLSNVIISPRIAGSLHKSGQTYCLSSKTT